ncbi:MAG: DEAD/DEAH box helicase, partial [Vicinamibacteria bacterium]
MTHWRTPPEVREPTDEALEAIGELEQLKRDLLDGVEEGDERWMVAQLLDYHRREAKPIWWAYFARLEMTPAELVDDPDSIGELEHLGAEPLPPPRRSIVHAFSFPPQEYKLGAGEEVIDPVTGLSAGFIESIDDEHGRLELVRGPSLDDVAPPKALIPGGPWDDVIQRKALRRLASSIRDDDGSYAPLRGILRRALPQIRDHESEIQTTDLGEMKRLLSALDGSHLFIQGPPGSGKTWTGARLISHLLQEGGRIGVASTSHKAIHNLLDEIEVAAKEDGVRFWGLKKSTEGNDESVYDSRHIQSASGIGSFAAPAVNLIAGTAWLFAREEVERAPVDYLFIDEAGQVSLADALAMGTCARNLVFLGDPLQLAQVTQGTHPPGTGVSVLEHLLGEAQTIPADRGVFLERTFRMHPDITAFVSEIVYEGRLRSAEKCARQGTSPGTGLRFIPVEHVSNRRRSLDEAEAVAGEIGRLLGAEYIDAEGASRPLTESDFMVVTPYNEQVRCLRDALPDDVRVGTVDKFQGQEAPIVFFSMATSSGANA